MTEYRSCLIFVVHRESSTLCSLKNAYIVVDNAPAPITPIRFHDWVLSLYIKDDVPKWDRRSGLFRDNDGNGFTTAICVKSQDQEIIIDTNDFMFYETDIPDASNEREPNYDEILPIYTHQVPIITLW